MKNYNTILQRIKEINKLIEKELTKRIIQEIPVKTLKWGEISDKKLTRNEAIKWAKEQGGRLPTRAELVQAYDDKVEGFKNDSYWSSTEDADDPGYGWSVYFKNGGVGLDVDDVSYYVRCVYDE
jgi:hypothetical protein